MGYIGGITHSLILFTNFLGHPSAKAWNYPGKPPGCCLVTTTRMTFEFLARESQPKPSFVTGILGGG